MWMSPNLTPIQTISIGIAIAVATVAALAALLTLAYAHQIRSYLTRLGLLAPTRLPNTDFRTTPFPIHYVLPEPRPELGRLSMATSTMMTNPSTTHRRPTTPSSSDEYVMSQEDIIPHNATPGPLHVLQADIQERSDTLPEDRNLRADDPWAGTENAEPDLDPEYPTILHWNADDIPELYRDWSRPVTPTIVIPDSDPELDPVPAYEEPQVPLPADRPGVLHPNPRRLGHRARNTIPFPTAPRYRLAHPPRPWPAEDSDTSSDGDEAPIASVSNLGHQFDSDPDPFADPHPQRSNSDPFNAHGDDYEWPELADIDREILGPFAVTAWEWRRLDIEIRLDWRQRGDQVHMDFYLAMERGDELRGGGMDAQIQAQI